MYFRKVLLILAIMIAGCLPSMAQEETKTSTEELKGKVDGIDENVTTLLTDVASLKKLKISGYFQFQFEKTEAMNGFGITPYDSSDKYQSRFRIRRGRVKVTYDAGLSQFVFQGDFTTGASTPGTGAAGVGFELKDFYLNLTDPWTNMFDLTAGLFNRPTYEVEYSSSVREAPERSKICGVLYPKERDMGLMITAHPEDWFKLQLAAFNNTFKGAVAQPDPGFRDDVVYYMARITKQFNIMEGLDIDLGAHGRFGQVRSNSRMFIPSDVPSKAANSKLDSSASNYGLNLSKSWFGGEMQLYWDAPLIGGTKLLAEYLTGSLVDELPLNTTALASRKIRKRDLSGFYAMLVKNIGSEWQLAARYDQYNPNTKISKDLADVAADLATTTVGFGIHNYTFSNIRITLWYDMITSATNSIIKTDPKDNLMTLRFQYKF